MCIYIYIEREREIPCARGDRMAWMTDLSVLGPKGSIFFPRCRSAILLEG